MNSKSIVLALGGRKKVIQLTGLTKGRISQWVVRNDIPKLWIAFLKLKYPNLQWKKLLAEQPDSTEQA